MLWSPWVEANNSLSGLKTIKKVDRVWLPMSLHGTTSRGSLLINLSSAISSDSGKIRRFFRLEQWPKSPNSRVAKKGSRGPTPMLELAASSSSILRSSMIFCNELCKSSSWDQLEQDWKNWFWHSLFLALILFYWVKIGPKRWRSPFFIHLR